MTFRILFLTRRAASQPGLEPAILKKMQVFGQALVNKNQPALRILNDCHLDLNYKDALNLNSTAGTDIRTFHHFGRSCGTCYGPVAENIHAANERVDIKSVINTARVYALFLSRWCGLIE